MMPFGQLLKKLSSGSREYSGGGGGEINASFLGISVNSKQGPYGAANTATFRVKVPPNVRPGEDFQVFVGSKIVNVKCPPKTYPGQKIQIAIPLDLVDCNDSGIATSSSDDSSGGSHDEIMNELLDNHPHSDKTQQMYEVAVPNGVLPGQPFSLLAGGVRVLVTCPPNALPGKTIRFNLPIALVNANKDGPKSKLAEIKLSYDKDGWTRTIRASDMMFQWTRFDTNGNVDTRQRFDTERSAYVRKLEWEEEEDRFFLRRGRVSLVTPDKGVVDSKITNADGTDLVTFQDIATAQNKSYEDKIQWFHDVCAQMGGDTSQYTMIRVRRDYLLSDSIEAVMSIRREDLPKLWRFHYIDEDGVDVGGLAREWFDLVTQMIFDPDVGLWQTSATNQMCMQINPDSELACPEDHLIYFRFIGRVLGKAVFDNRLVKGHMVKHLYKHILGWPIMFNDLKDIDELYYNSLRQLKDLGADVKDCCIDFTVTEDKFGGHETVELLPNGSNMVVTEENLPEYIEACLKYRTLGRFSNQLNELLLGFFDVVPEPLLSIFDFQELELLMCGLPNIDMEDWMMHTEYSGEYDRDGQHHEVCIWFWEVVSEYDQEMKARLLQFVTGTSGVPARGFGSLQGNDRNLRSFTINGVTLETCMYPRAHTCFNRIDLPLYKNKKELEEKMSLAITMASTGFDIE